MYNQMKKKNKFGLLHKEQNEFYNNRLKKIKSSNYINCPKSLTLSKDKKIINDNKSKKF